jgi:hypothetical protein
VPAPSDIDGKVPAEAFNDETSGRIQLVKSGEPGYRRPVGHSGQDTEKIEKQLRAVGYIQ